MAEPQVEWFSQGLNKNMFNFVQVVGKGGFGKVWRVEHKKTREKFALKEMSKIKYATLNQDHFEELGQIGDE